METFGNSNDVYDYIVNNADLHPETENIEMDASEAKIWCELANVGDKYITEDFTLECVYRFS